MSKDDAKEARNRIKGLVKRVEYFTKNGCDLENLEKLQYDLECILLYFPKRR
jgi:hypothetical protein